jgi:NADH-ubiquinone oxidoreductase chain 1
MSATILYMVVVIFNVALSTVAERKIMASMQRRIGPNKVGYTGLFQAFADGFKLILKECIIPSAGNKVMFILAPYLFFYLALLNWSIMPLSDDLALTEYVGAGIVILIAISELAIFGVLYSGWSSNSKYALLGALRSTSQMISYSICLSLIYLSVVMVVGSVNLLEILDYNKGIMLIIPLWPMAGLLMISIVLECNRSPADLPEAESELVSGFNTEYSGLPFAYFFLGEYTNMLCMSHLFFVLFTGYSISAPFLFLFFWLRASLPRMRFDQILILCWNHILPFVIGYFLLIPVIMWNL